MTPAVAALPGVTVYTKKCEDVLSELIAAGPYGEQGMCNHSKIFLEAESMNLYAGAQESLLAMPMWIPTMRWHLSVQFYRCFHRAVS